MERTAALLSRQEQAALLRRRYPCMTLEQIGERLGVSRERARQLLVKQKLPTSHVSLHTKVYCLNCGQPTRNRRFCSHSCQKQYNLIPLVCSWCGKLFYRPINQFRSRFWAERNKKGLYTGRYFCGRSCQGQWLGHTYGRGRPGNPHRFKYDHEAIREMIAAGLGVEAVAERLGSSKTATYTLLRRIEQGKDTTHETNPARV